jgi:DNA adenine methylase
MIFRYPGAKNRLLHTLNPFLDRVLAGAESFHDVFIGGGSVLLHVARRCPNLRLHANDADDHVAAFWKIIASNRVDELCDRLRVKPTVELFYELKAQRPNSKIDKAFRFVFLNRTAFSGLWHSNRSTAINPIGGRMQVSRYRVFTNWTGKQLVEDILEAPRLLAGRLTVSSMDGGDYVRRHPEGAKYVDPPYFERGGGLYGIQMTLADHLRLAEGVRSTRNWVLSYDDTPAVRELYAWADCHSARAIYRFNQKGKECVRADELVIVPRKIN